MNWEIALAKSSKSPKLGENLGNFGKDFFQELANIPITRFGNVLLSLICYTKLIIIDF